MHSITTIQNDGGGGFPLATLKDINRRRTCSPSVEYVSVNKLSGLALLSVAASKAFPTDNNIWSM